MAPDERRRLQLADAAKAALGDDAGITLMDLLPPVGVVDQRLERVERRLDGVEQRLEEMAHEIRAQTWKLVTLMVAVVGVVVAAVRL